MNSHPTRQFIYIFLCLVSQAWASPKPGELELRTIILANSTLPESMELAHFYAKARGIPVENIISLKAPSEEAIRWKTYVETIHTPLQNEFLKSGWLDAEYQTAKDPQGRAKHTFYGHKIAYLVVCRGMPLKIWHDASQPTSPDPAITQNPRLEINAAALDAELALLATLPLHPASFTPNPLFRNDSPTRQHLHRVIKVGRLDGPTLEDAKQLVTGALKAEQIGLIGRSYIDLGGPHAMGDEWLRVAKSLLDANDFVGDTDIESRTFAAWSRMDFPAFYFGWYAPSVNGPISAPSFRFAPGAIALHIHSASADTIRSPTSRWVGPLIARGAAATFGNVNEPLLALTHQPHLLLQALFRGDSLGDAAAYALPAYSWQAVMIGDPLYRPFKITLEEQWAGRDHLDSGSRAYITLRRMRQVERSGDIAQAIRLATTAQQAEFHPAIALAIFELQQARNDREGMASALVGFTRMERISPEAAPLFVLAAEHFRTLGNTDDALRLYQALLATTPLPVENKTRWLKSALAAASPARHRSLRLEWEKALATLNAPSRPD